MPAVAPRTSPSTFKDSSMVMGFSKEVTKYSNSPEGIKFFTFSVQESYVVVEGSSLPIIVIVCLRLSKPIGVGSPGE